MVLNILLRVNDVTKQEQNTGHQSHTLIKLMTIKTYNTCQINIHKRLIQSNFEQHGQLNT